MLIPSQVCFAGNILVAKQEGVETGRAAPKGQLRLMVKGQSRPRTFGSLADGAFSNGGESRGGMNPGVDQNLRNYSIK